MEVVDSVADYLTLLKEVFDFPALRAYVTRPDFSMVFDAMHAVTGAYAGPIFVEALGADASSVRCGAWLLPRHVCWPGSLIACIIASARPEVIATVSSSAL